MFKSDITVRKVFRRDRCTRTENLRMASTALSEGDNGGTEDEEIVRILRWAELK